MFGGVGHIGLNGSLGAATNQATVIPIFGPTQPLWIRPESHGTGSGLDFNNAASPSAIPGFLKYFAAGTDVLFVADDGDYTINSSLNTIAVATNVGTAAQPVRFMGVQSDGVTPMKAVFNGTRDASPTFKLTGGTTSGSPTVTFSDTTGLAVGMTVMANNLNYPAVIQSISTNVSVTLNKNASSTNASTTCIISPLLYRTNFETSGYDLFDLRPNISYTSFENFTLNNVGSVFLPQGNVTGCSFTDVDGVNFFDFFNGESDTLGNPIPADLYYHTTVTFTRCTGTGFSGGGIRTWQNPKEIKHANCTFDAQKQIDVAFNICFHLGGTGRLSTDPAWLAINPNGGPIYTDCVANNAWYHSTASNYPNNIYWNADGFCNEDTIDGPLYKNCTANGNTDGGFDLKSSNTIIDNPSATGNKFNFKLWNTGTVLNGSSTDPVKIGGSGSVGHIAYFGSRNINWTFNGTTFTGNTGNSAMLLDLETSATGANVLTLTSYTLSLQSGTVLIDTPTAPGTITVHATPPLPS